MTIEATAMRSTAQAELDHPVTIAVMLWAGIAGAFTTVVLPLVVSGVAKGFDLSASAAGYVASAEMAGIAVGAFVAGLRMATANRRNLVLVCALIAALANLACVWVDNFSVLLLLRFVGGLGGGGLLATMAAAVGGTTKTERNFAIFPAMAFICATIAFQVLPGLLERHGLGLLFLVLTAINALVLPFAFLRFPAYGPAPVAAAASASAAQASSSAFTVPVLLALGGILAYYVGVGGVWPMMQQIGESLTLPTADVTAVLARCSLAGMTGAILAAVMGSRFGRVLPMSIGIGGIVASLAAIGVTKLGAVFLIAPIAFLFFWNLAFPYLMGTLAVLDTSGRAMAFNMTLQYVGFAVGPVVAGAIAGVVGIADVVWLGAVGCSLSLALFLLATTAAKPQAA